VTRLTHWSREALNDIKAQIAYIARDDREAAVRIADRILDTGEALGRHATGRPGRVTGTYEKSVGRLPYIIAYALSERAGQEIIVILRVIHAARDWPPEGWPG
jgi:plasmid stabilization system protein ParE